MMLLVYWSLENLKDLADRADRVDSVSKDRQGVGQACGPPETNAKKSYKNERLQFFRGRAGSSSMYGNTARQIMHVLFLKNVNLLLYHYHISLE